MKDKIIAIIRAVSKKKIPHTMDKVHRALREAEPRTTEELEKEFQEHCKVYDKYTKNIMRYRITGSPGLEGMKTDEFIFCYYGLNPDPSMKVNQLDSCISKLSNPEYKKIFFPLHVESESGLPQYLWQDNPLLSMEDLKYVVEKLDHEKIIIRHSILCPGSDKLDGKLREYGLDKYRMER